MMLTNYIRNIIYIIFIGFLFTACEQDEPVIIEHQSKPVTVKLNIRQQPTTGTRASSAMEPEKENFIYDIWLLQYNSSGELTSAGGTDKSQHLRVGEAGVAEVSDLLVTLEALDNSTICLVANLGESPLDNNASWPENLDDFKKLTIPIDYLSGLTGNDEEGHVSKIGLFGYYEGPVNDNIIINISLSRLISRLRLNVKSIQELNGPLELKLENVRSRINIFPTEMPYQPIGTTEAEKAADRAANFTSFTHTLPYLGTEGIVQYYYTGENINPSHEYATKLIVNNADISYSVLLGSDSPQESEPSSRNLSIKRNNAYTFDIKLKVGQYVEEQIVRDGWTASGGSGVNYADRIINNSNDNNFTFIFKSSLGTFITIDTKKETKFNAFSLKQREGSYDFKVGNVTLLGSHDNSNFTPITTVDIPAAYGEQLIKLPETVEFRYLRLVFNSWMNNSTGNVYLSQFNLNYNRYE